MKRRAAAVAAVALLCPLATCRDAVAPAPASPGVAAVTGLSASVTTASWVQLASTLDYRRYATASAGPDGRIYVFGGAIGDFERTAEVYDPALDTWSYIAPIGGIAGQGIARIGNKIYLMGGFVEDGAVGATIIYNTTTNSYSSGHFFSPGRAQPTAATLPSGQVILAGGWDGEEAWSTAALYNPATNTWSATGSMAFRRYGAAGAVAPDGKFYVFGGRDLTNALREVEAYDPATGTWTRMTAMPRARWGHGAVTGADGLIYVFGGSESASTAFSNVTAVDVFDPSRNSWSSASPTRTLHSQLAYAGGADGRVYAIGGSDPKFVEALETTPQLTTNVTLTSSVNPSVFGQSVNYVVTVVRSDGVLPNDGEPVKLHDNGQGLGIAELRAGTATFTRSDFAVGAHNLTATYPGSSQLPAAVSNAVVQSVGKSATVTTFNATPTPSVFGSDVIYGAHIDPVAPGSGSPDGTWTLSLDGSPLFTIPVGQIGPILSIPVGTHTFTATYNGSANYSGSTVSRTHVVTKVPTTVALTSSANPSVFGQSVQFIATVSCNGPLPANGEQVTFMDGSSPLGTGTISGGTALLNTSLLGAGSHSITAVYGGNGVLDGSTSAVVTQTVNRASTTLTLSSAPSPSIIGQAVVNSAAISVVAPGAGSPTGSVTFSVDGAVYGVTTLSNGMAQAPALSNLSLGTHAFSAVYSGDANFEPASDQDAHTVNPPPNSAPVASAGGPYSGNEGSPIALSAAGSSDPDNDPLTYDWNFGDGTSAVNAGVAPSHAYADNGTYTAVVTVRDDHGHVASASASVNVGNVAPTVSAIAGAQIFTGDAYSASGTFTDPGADTFTGSVDYGDGTAVAISVGGNAFSLNHTYAAAGTYTVTVSVSDDDGGQASQSATVTVLSAATGTQVLGGSVETLLTSGAITSQTSTQFTTSLNQVSASLASGNTNAATGQVDSFINKVQAAINSGKISASDGNALIAFANQVKATITP